MKTGYVAKFALILIALFTINSCASRSMETEITGQTASCSDGKHQVLNCQSIFSQYKRNFEAGVKLLDAIGAKFSLPAQPLMTLDSLTGDLMLYRQSLCRNYNNCLITKAEYIAEERKLTELQIDLRKAAALAEQGYEIETTTTIAEGSNVDLGNAEPAPMETASVYDKEVSDDYDSKSVTGKIAEVLGVIKGDIVRTRGLNPNQAPSTAPAPRRLGGSNPPSSKKATPSSSSTAAQQPDLAQQPALAQQVDALLAQLSQQLQQKAPDKLGTRVVIGSINSRADNYETPFGRHVATLVTANIKKTGTYQIVPPKRLRGIGIVDNPKRPMTLAKYAGADLVLHGVQSDQADGVQIELALSDQSSARPLAIVRSLFAKANIPAAYPAQTSNIEAVRDNQRVLTQLGEKASGRLKVELWTDRGGQSATYYEGEPISVVVRVNQDSFLRLFYLDASGNTVQLFPNAHSISDRISANQEVNIPSPDSGYKFAVQPPFGTEQLVAIASITPIPETKGVAVGGGQILMPNVIEGIVEPMQQIQVAAATRGITEDPGIAWDTIMLTTAPKPTSPSAAVAMKLSARANPR